MTIRKARIHPSILSADYTDLKTELKRIHNADSVHIDVMDNHFVPNLSVGAPVVKKIKKVSPVPLDVHLMIENADYWAIQYAELAVDSVTFHAEATAAPIRLASELRSRGVKVGMALNPATPLTGYLPVLSELDMLLIMTVEPGFGGQSFLKSMLPKIIDARRAVESFEKQVDIQVDGGITMETIVAAAEAGATNFVAGSAIYNTEDPSASIESLRDRATLYIQK